VANPRACQRRGQLGLLTVAADKRRADGSGQWHVHTQPHARRALNRQISTASRAGTAPLFAPGAPATVAAWIAETEVARLATAR